MIYLFDKEENLIHIIPRKDVIDAVQPLEINKTISLECELRSNKYDFINKAEYVGHFYDNTFYMYRILRINISSTTVLTGVHIVFDELKSNGYIRDIRPKNMTASIALSKILDGTRWQIGRVQSDVIGSSNWYDKSKLEALSDYLEHWNVELDYRIDFDGSKIRGRYVDIYDKMGDDTGLRLVYGSNALEVKAETSKSEVYTALIGRGKGEEKVDETGQATGGYGRRINFKEVEWSVSNGKPVDKPLRQEFVENKEATKMFGFSDGKPRIKVEVFENCTDPAELLELTYQKLLTVSRPLVTFTTSVHKIGNVNLGDRVNIIRRDLNMFYKARIFKIERNLLENSLSKIELGDYIASNSEKHRTEIIGKLDASNSAIASLGNSIEGLKNDSTNKINKLLEDLKNGLELQYYNDKAYNYELSDGNKWKLPAGYYSFDRPIDMDPTKVICLSAGKLMIANRKKSDGSWDWSTFGTGDGFTADSLNSGHINVGLIDASSITSSHIDSAAIDTRHIRSNAITADKIQARAITADEIDVGTITAREIKSSTITGDEVAYNTLDSRHIRDITVDILRPGSNNRIIFEGSSPGDNDCLSLDATGGMIRLKSSASDYVRVENRQITFFTSGGKTYTRYGDMFANNFTSTSDVRSKENLTYLGKEHRLKQNPNVKVVDISESEIVEFIKSIKLATYNYQFQNKSQIGVIAQDVEKFDKVKDYIVGEIDKRKHININNFISMQTVAIQKLMRDVEELKNKLEGKEGE